MRSPSDQIGTIGPDTRFRRAKGLLVLTVEDDQISTVTRFGDNGLLVGFGLPATL